MKGMIAQKLAIRYRIDLSLAMALVEAGFDKPNKIVAAKQSELEKVAGVGPATAQKLKER